MGESIFKIIKVIFDWVLIELDKRLFQKEGVGYRLKKFQGNYISLGTLKKSAIHLQSQIREYSVRTADEWRAGRGAEMIVGINQGGMIIASALSYLRSNPHVGWIQTERTQTHLSISLPLSYEKGERFHIPQKTDYPFFIPKRIIVTDTKLKSGRAAIFIQNALHEIYGNGIKILFAIGLVYIGGSNANWKDAIIDNPNWPARISICERDDKGDRKRDDKGNPIYKEITLFCSYYTLSSPPETPNLDPIHEVLRFL